MLSLTNFAYLIMKQKKTSKIKPINKLPQQQIRQGQRHPCSELHFRCLRVQDWLPHLGQVSSHLLSEKITLWILLDEILFVLEFYS